MRNLLRTVKEQAAELARYRLIIDAALDDAWAKLGPPIYPNDPDAEAKWKDALLAEWVRKSKE